MINEFKAREYRSVRWGEPIILEKERKGKRGIIFTEVEEEVNTSVGDVYNYIPATMKRTESLNLPELSEEEVLRHYLRLSQETMGMLGTSFFGTCTMKYPPKISEFAALRPQMTQLHPLQDDDTLQGMLEIIYKSDLMFRELTAMDQFIFQAGGGTQASFIFTCVLRAYLEAKGELGKRDEIVCTLMTHPGDASAAATAGFKVITLMPDETGYPSTDALKAVLSERTAALMTTNPDDTGIFNPNIAEWVKLVHDAGGLCFYDQANFNGVMGMIRVGDIGFDACMYMLHKTFGAPKGGMGPAAGAFGCNEKLVNFLPSPIVKFDGNKYYLDRDLPNKWGKVREFYGNVQLVLKAYAWILTYGLEGIREACQLSVIANNYLEKLLMTLPGLSMSFPKMTKKRLEMTRYSWEKLKEDTGVGTEDVQNRMLDFGIDKCFLSHEPWIVPEPYTPEVGETYSKEDIESYAAVIKKIVEEAYTNPEIVKTSPHNQVTHRINPEPANDPEKWAMTWRAFLKKNPNYKSNQKTNP